MLVLTRRRNEKIVIDDSIVITVCQIEQGKVRIGVDAPADIPIRREELIRQWSEPASAELAKA